MTIFEGKTITGDGRGKTLGFPTLNIFLPNEINTSELQKNSGVFIVEVTLKKYKNIQLIGLLHLGSRPTFHEKEFRIEIFVLENVSSNFFDIPKNEIIEILQNVETHSVISFQIIEKIRNIIHFSSAKKLVEQIKKDVKTAEDFYREKEFTL